MGREPLTREEYEDALSAYIDEYKNSHIDEWTFQQRLRNIGTDRDEIDYLIRTNRP